MRLLSDSNLIFRQISARAYLRKSSSRWRRSITLSFRLWLSFINSSRTSVCGRNNSHSGWLMLSRRTRWSWRARLEITRNFPKMKTRLDLGRHLPCWEKAWPEMARPDAKLHLPRKIIICEKGWLGWAWLTWGCEEWIAVPRSTFQTWKSGSSRS